MTIRDLLFWATKKLDAAGIPSARLDAEVLLAFGLGCERLDFIKNDEKIVPFEQEAAFFRMVDRRLNFEPVAYITGRKAFWSFTLDVNKDVLIPRPDTEILVEEALEILKCWNLENPRIADVGTGSGAIALALATEIPGARVLATDISPSALSVAKRNAQVLALDSSIDFLPGDLLEPVEGPLDMIVSNPPYIGATEYDGLDVGVRDFEPRLALWAGKTGMEFYEKLIYQAQSYLHSGGWLLLEIGARQRERVVAILEESGCYDGVAVRADYAGFPRVIKGRRK